MITSSQSILRPEFQSEKTVKQIKNKRQIIKENQQNNGIAAKTKKEKTLGEKLLLSILRIFKRIINKLFCVAFWKFVLPFSMIFSVFVGLCYGGAYLKDHYFHEPLVKTQNKALSMWAAWRNEEFKPIEIASNDVESAPAFNIDWNNPCYASGLLLARKYNVPENVVVNIIHTESRGKPNATNRNTNGTTDHGCMQLNDKFHGKHLATGEIYLAPINVELGVKFLASLYKEVGDWKKAAVMYNTRTRSLQSKYRGFLNASSKRTGAPMPGELY